MHLVVDDMLLRERRVWTAWFDEVVDLEAAGEWAALAQGELDLVVDTARITVRGELYAQVPRACDRCLGHFLQPVETRLSEVCLIGDEGSAEAAWDEDDEIWLVSQGGRVSLTEMARQALLLALPSRAVCGDDCRALIVPADQEPVKPARDPRWAKLAELFERGEDDNGSPEA